MFLLLLWILEFAIISFFLLSIYWQHYDKLNVLVCLFLYFNTFHPDFAVSDCFYRTLMNETMITPIGLLEQMLCLFSILTVFILFQLDPW